MISAIRAKELADYYNHDLLNVEIINHAKRGQYSIRYIVPSQSWMSADDYKQHVKTLGEELIEKGYKVSYHYFQDQIIHGRGAIYSEKCELTISWENME